MSGRGSRAALGVVVVNFGSHALLEENLVGLDVASLDATVVVVDSFHSTSERQAVEDLAGGHGWRLIAPSGNLGFGVAANLGASLAADLGCSHLLLLNPDVAVDVVALHQLLEASARHPEAILSPVIHRPDGSIWFAGGQLDERNGLISSRRDVEQVSTSRWLTAACLMVPASVWTRLGGFDPRFFLYWEDVEMTRRHLAGGGELLVLHDLRVTHAVGATQPGEGKSTAYAYFMCRNRLLYATLRHGWAGRLRWLWASPRYAARVVLRDGRRGLLRNPRLASAALRGTLAGLLLMARGSRPVDLPVVD